jgi:hypothetical protein
MMFALSFLPLAVAISMCLGALNFADPKRAVRQGMRNLGALLAIWAVLSLLLAVAQQGWLQ